ncbi:hypothetical protein CEXT_584181 [Caerostris extrusa]|uniref:Uncharacterized protein n=1 Tax=Caerostris extrusa TaxID=172846 RepID=A0AAV4MRL9_CAEEX|nr:hypothetical protein CEXT_584181 [Caerostris extrusa]
MSASPKGPPGNLMHYTHFCAHLLYYPSAPFLEPIGGTFVCIYCAHLWCDMIHKSRPCSQNSDCALYRTQSEIHAADQESSSVELKRVEIRLQTPQSHKKGLFSIISILVKKTIADSSCHSRIGFLFGVDFRILLLWGSRTRCLPEVGSVIEHCFVRYFYNHLL